MEIHIKWAFLTDFRDRTWPPILDFSSLAPANLTFSAALVKF